jgi:hypothetical protein
MTRRQLRRRYNRKRMLWFCIRWSVALGILYACFLYIYPQYLINDSPDILPFLARYPVAERLMAWLPERTVLPFVYPSLAPYINPGVEYAWLLFLAVCMAVSIVGSFLIMTLWRFLSTLGIRAARRARRAICVFFIALLLVAALNFGLGALVITLWTKERQLVTFAFWDWLMHLGIFVAVPVVTLLSAWLAAPARISGKRCFFR